MAFRNSGQRRLRPRRHGLFVLPSDAAHGCYNHYVRPYSPGNNRRHWQSGTAASCLFKLDTFLNPVIYSSEAPYSFHSVGIPNRVSSAIIVRNRVSSEMDLFSIADDVPTTVETTASPMPTPYTGHKYLQLCLKRVCCLYRVHGYLV